LFKKLAIDGGKPYRSQPIPQWPFYSDDEIALVTEVLRAGKVNAWTGAETKEFEKTFAAACQCEHAIALANGTVALELALLSIGIGAGDAVIVTSRTFIASASAIVAVGARPVFADVDPVTQNITAESISAVLSSDVKAVIVVHLAGWPCDMQPIADLSEEHGFNIVEDCAQAHGATYQGMPVGSLGDVAAFSFCQDKIISTGGEGGMLLTNNREIWKRAWSYKDHGKNPDLITPERTDTTFRWLHESFGTNWRLSGIQSAIGLRQTEKLPLWVAQRRNNASILSQGLKGTPGIRLTLPSDKYGHSYYKYYCFVELDALAIGWTRDRIVAAIIAEGIPSGQGSCSEIYLEKAFDRAGCRPKSPLPMAKQLGDTSLMFPVHPTLTEDDLQDMVKVINKVMSVAANGA